MKFSLSKALFGALLLGLFIPAISSAQTFSLSGQVGYAGPQGDAFKDPVTDEKQSSFGIGYDFDAMYYLESFDEKLSVGLMFSGNALFGKNSSDAFDIGIYGLSLYGVKSQYRFLDRDNTFSPYGALGLGLSQFSTPDVTISDASGSSTVVEGERAFSFGLRPELGLEIGGFLVSAAYFVPMKYTIESDTGNFDGSAGTLNISIGYRYYFEL